MRACLWAEEVAERVVGMVGEPVTSVEVKAFFGRVSVDWDEMRSSFYNAGVIDALVEHAGVGAASMVVDLDVGTGTDFVAAGLAPVAAAGYEWMRTEQADVWLGFTRGEVMGFFSTASLVDFGYASLGMQ